jgi:hypothetical protein
MFRASKTFTGPHTLRDIGEARFGLLTGGACAGCNNGWMSRLEQVAKSILEPMARGEPAVLTDSQQEVVTRWLLKTSLMYEQGLFHGFGTWRMKGVEPHFGIRDRRVLYRNQPIPNGTFAYIGRFADGVAAWIGDPDYYTFAATSALPTVSVLLHTFAINHLAFQLCTFRWRADFVPFAFEAGFEVKISARWRDQLVQVGPSSPRVQWPPPVALNVTRMLELADRTP